MLLAQQRRDDQRVIVGRQERIRPGEEVPIGTPLVDGKVVHHGLHGKGQRVLEPPLAVGHERQQVVLRLPAAPGVNDEPHTPA